MKKTTGIKAKKLMVDDHLKIGGVMFRIASLSRSFGSGRKEPVRISLRPLDKKHVGFNQLSVKPGTLFTIYNQK